MSQIISLGFAGLVFLFILNSLVSRWRYAKRARDLGCQPPPARVNRLVFGIDAILDLNKADKENAVPQQVMRQYEEVGYDTFKQSLLGSSIIVTYNPENLRAVLAAQFQDFELGPKRRNIFFPMLGNGIFTADGPIWYVIFIARRVFIVLSYSLLVQGTLASNAATPVCTRAGI
jgi:hypothetical protein